MHVLLDDDRLEQLRKRAEAKGASVGELIRSAIDRELESDAQDELEAAARSFLAAPPFPVPSDPRELRRELDELWERKPWPEPESR
ncbi:MAG: ribbon-helix-helix protein, CopG family [Thermoleophilaceae bacterium]